MSPKIALLMLLLQAPLLQSIPPGKGAIEGVVLAAGTDEPIEDARVILARADETADRSDDPSRSVITDRQGRFVFKDLDSGSYRLAFESNGYVRQEYGQRVFPGSGTTLELAGGQGIRNLVVRMTRTASIGGRILDEQKQPVVGVPVQLMRSSYDRGGDRTLHTYGTAQTDDRGEYRLYFITPGRYYLRAGTPQGTGCCNGLRPSANEVPSAVASTYYPGVANLQSAMPLEVKAGNEISGISWTLSRQRLFKIRGRVIDTTTGQPPTEVQLLLFTESGNVTEQFGGPKGAYENGIFEFRDLVPGLYGLRGSVQVPAASQGYIPVDVSSDLDGLVLPVSPGGSISGRVRIDGADPQLSASFGGEDVGLWLSVAVNGSQIATPGQSTPFGNVEPDGTFQIDNILPGDYNFGLWLRDDSPLPMKTALLGGADALSKPIHITGQESKTLDILVSSGVGTLNGSVTVAQGSAAGVQVVLVPDRLRNRTELFRAVMTNQDGRFSISNIVPGDYKIFAWEAIELYSWFDPQVLARDESGAKPVHVAELSTQTIEIKALP